MSNHEEMSDSEMWHAVKNRGQEKRASNRENSASLLTQAGIPFQAHNASAHLVVAGHIDFWPGTGLWMVRKSNKRRYGVRGLINYVKSSEAMRSL